MRILTSKWLIILLVLIAPCYLGSIKFLEWKMHDADFIKTKLGYALPKHWKIESTSSSNGRYYWTIDGSINNSWVESFNAIPIPTTEPGFSGTQGWVITKNQIESSVMKRCKKGCCVYITVTK